MNRTPIEYVHYTWNPLVGCNGPEGKGPCWYCYAHRFAKRNLSKCRLCREFTPHVHVTRIPQPLGITKARRIFVCSMGDFFGHNADERIPAIPEPGGEERDITVGWFQNAMRNTMKAAPQHKYLILTKQPQNVPGWWNSDLPNCWVGVSITHDKDVWRWKALTERISARRFISFEPLLLEIESPLLWEIGHAGYPDWAIIGILTGPGANRYWPPPWKLSDGSMESPPTWITWILRFCEGSQRASYLRVPVFVKKNVAPIWAGPWPQEIPDDLKVGAELEAKGGE